MTQEPPCQIRGALTSVLRPARIVGLAELLGAVVRRRKVDIVALVAALVFGSLGRQRRTLEGLRRLYERATGQTLARSSFHARLNQGLAVLMQVLCGDALAQAATLGSPLARRFLKLRKVLLIDSTMVRLSRLLEVHYPSVWTNHTKAAAKLTVVVNAERRTPERLTIGPASRHDVHQVTYGPWVYRCLIIADQAFTRSLSLAEIEAHGGYFLGRLKPPTSPLLERSHLGKNDRLVGKRLADVSDLLVGDEVDFDATVPFRSRKPWRYGQLQTRLVGVRIPDGTFHFYLTNLPHDQFSPAAVAALYAARWEVELLFREMKSILRAAEMPTSSKAAVDALLYASILAVLASRAIHRTLIADRDGRDRYPMERFTALLGAFLDELVSILIHKATTHRRLGAALANHLVHEGRDPNVHRVPLGHRLKKASEGHR